MSKTVCKHSWGRRNPKLRQKDEDSTPALGGYQIMTGGY